MEKPLFSKSTLYKIVPFLSVATLPVEYALAGTKGTDCVGGDPVNDPFGLNCVDTPLGNNDLLSFIQSLINYVLGFLAIVVFLIVLYAGFQWMTSAGDEKKIGSAKDRITSAVVGLVIIFLAWAIVSFVFTIIGKAAKT